MATFDLLLLVAGGLLLALDVWSEVLRRVWLSVPLAATIAGVLLGPEVLGVLEPERLGDPMVILEGLARLALALMVVDVGLRMDRRTLRACRRAVTRLLLIGMPVMWVATGLLAWALLDVPFWVGMLIGAILTPTDPVVSSSLTSEAIAARNLPTRLRRQLQLESGANDGLAIVLFLLPALVLAEPSGEVAHWLGKAAREVGVAAAGGLLVGVAAAHVTNRALRQKDVQQPLLVGVTVGLALATLGAAHLLEGSGILAAFLAATCFAVVLDGDARERLEGLHETVANLPVPIVFAFFGAVLPWGGWADLGWLGVVFALAVLVVRRPAGVAAALPGSDVPARDRAFLAWFGPLGVAAMYYATLAQTYDVPEKDTIFLAAALAIVASVVAHSVTATPAALRYAGKPLTRTIRRPGSGE